MNAEMDGKHQVLPKQQLRKGGRGVVEDVSGVGGGGGGRWGGVDVLFG